MHAPTDLDWHALKRVLRYLHGTLRQGLLLRHKSPIQLHVFTDATSWT